jgi:phospholipid/cholesterol/gamma-HCH transport system substrate-binding protein
MNRSTIDLWVGVFVAAGFGALLFLALKVGNLASFSTAETYIVQAKFANIGGLKVRAPVKSAGVVVGRVAEIRFDTETYEAIVSMNLQSAYIFPRDTSAKILTSGLLGEQYIGLDAGGDGVMLKHGDRLRLTQSAVVLENLISQFLFNKAAEGGDGDAKGGGAAVKGGEAPVKGGEAAKGGEAKSPGVQPETKEPAKGPK